MEKKEHRLIGLTTRQTHQATLQPMENDSDTYWAIMPDDLWNQWWPFFKHSEENQWKKAWIAEVSENENKELVVVNIRQWDKSYPPNPLP